MPVSINRVALYARVSTKEQANRGLSIPSQLRALQDHCETKGYEIVKQYADEGFSGTDENRPQLQALKSDVESEAIEIDAIIVIESSRFFRNTFLRTLWKDRLANYGVHVISMNQSVESVDTADGELYESLLAVFAENESRRIGERTLRGMQENARQGFHNGALAPYGYSVQKTPDDRGNFKSKLVVNPKEAEVVKSIFEMYVLEGMGALEIAKRLHATKQLYRGKKWDKHLILRMLENPIYIGQAIYNRFRRKKNKHVGDGNKYTFLERPKAEWIVNAVTPIIDMDFFELAQQERGTKLAEKRNGKAHNSTMLLTGILKCGKCGSSLVTEKAKNGKYTYYLCARTKNGGVTNCSGHRLPARAAENFILDQLITKAFSEANVKMVIHALRQAALAEQRPLKEVRIELDDLTARLQRYYEAFETGAMQIADVGDRLKDLKVRHAKLKAEYDERTSVELPSDEDITPEKITALQSAMREALRSGTHQMVKQYLGILLKEVVVDGEQFTMVGKTEGMLAVLEENKNVRTEASLQFARPVVNGSP